MTTIAQPHPAAHDAAAPARHADSRRSSAAAPHAVAQGGDFLAFRLGAEEFGIDILRVQEIRSYEPPTRIAHAPRCVKGVVNLRGTIVPIVDLRLALGCARADYNACTVVVVLNVRGRVVGAVVDAVSDVLALRRDQIQPAPAVQPGMDPGIGAAFITGSAALAGSDARMRMLTLLDIEALMGSAEIGLVGH